MVFDWTVPSAADITDIHREIVSEYPDTTTAGIRTSVDRVLPVDRRGTPPTESIHAYCAALFRELVCQHPFVDGNKRTAISAVAATYLVNGHDVVHGSEMYAVVRQLASQPETMSRQDIRTYFTSVATPPAETTGSPVEQTLSPGATPSVLASAAAHRDLYRDIYDELATS